MSFFCLNPALKQVRWFATPAHLPSPICTAVLVQAPSPLPWPWHPRGPPLPSRTGTRAIFYTINQSISFSCLKLPWPPCRLDCRCPPGMNPLVMVPRGGCCPLLGIISGSHPPSFRPVCGWLVLLGPRPPGFFCRILALPTGPGSCLFRQGPCPLRFPRWPCCSLCPDIWLLLSPLPRGSPMRGGVSVCFVLS